MIRNNRFVRCSDHDLYVHPWHSVPGGQLADFTIENNFFGATSIGYYSGQFARGYATCDNFILRNNVLEQSWVFDCPSSSTATAPRISGNYWGDQDPPSTCGVVGMWRANIFDRAPRPCDPSQKLVTVGKDMTLTRADVRRGLARVGFGCGDPVVSASRSVIVCVLRRKPVVYRALIVASPSGSLRFVATTCRRPRGHRSARRVSSPEFLLSRLRATRRTKLALRDSSKECSGEPAPRTGGSAPHACGCTARARRGMYCLVGSERDAVVGGSQLEQPADSRRRLFSSRQRCRRRRCSRTTRSE